MLDSIIINGGRDKDCRPERVPHLSLAPGDIYTIVGYTGSGKTQLIRDIEQLANRDTVSKRQVLINSKPFTSKKYDRYTKKLVAHLSQNMNFVLDMGVAEFIGLHATCRGFSNPPRQAEEVINCANTLSGEEIHPDENLTRLSGGQSRSLMIADVAINGDSPIVLIDEVENAGINRLKALEILSSRQRIVLVVTHDPLLALYGEKRIIMNRGGMSEILETTKEEKNLYLLLKEQARQQDYLQQQLRIGKELRLSMMERKIDWRMAK